MQNSNVIELVILYTLVMGQTYRLLELRGSVYSAVTSQLINIIIFYVMKYYCVIYCE